MRETRKGYVLTEGSYSDYRILGVFSSPENAMAYTDYPDPELWEYEEGGRGFSAMYSVKNKVTIDGEIKYQYTDYLTIEVYELNPEREVKR